MLRTKVGLTLVTVCLSATVGTMALLFLGGCGNEPESSSPVEATIQQKDESNEGGRFTKDLVIYAPGEEFWTDQLTGVTTIKPERFRRASETFREFGRHVEEASRQRSFEPDDLELFFKYATERPVSLRTGYLEYTLHWLEFDEEGVAVEHAVTLCYPENLTRQVGQRETGNPLDTWRSTTYHFFQQGGTAPTRLANPPADEGHIYFQRVVIAAPLSGETYCGGTFTIESDYIPRVGAGHNLITNTDCCTEATYSLPFTTTATGGSNKYCVKARLKVGTSEEMAWTTKANETTQNDLGLIWANAEEYSVLGSQSVPCTLFVAPHFAIKYQVDVPGFPKYWMWQSAQSSTGSGCSDERYGWGWCPTYCSSGESTTCMGNTTHGRMKWGAGEFYGAQGGGFFAWWKGRSGTCVAVDQTTADGFYFHNGSVEASITMIYSDGVCP